MADSTIDSELIFLRCGRFGTPDYTIPPPGGFTGSTTHNVATAARPVGEVRRVYCDGSVGQPGYSEFVYLKYEGTGAPTSAAKQVCVPDAVGSFMTVTNDPDSSVQHDGCMVAVVAISAMTDAYYGWFWCGGVCPEQYVSALGGNYATDNGVVAGNIISKNLSADAIGFGTKGAFANFTIGFALAADV